MRDRPVARDRRHSCDREREDSCQGRRLRILRFSRPHAALRGRSRAVVRIRGLRRGHVRGRHQARPAGVCSAPGTGDHNQARAPGDAARRRIAPMTIPTKFLRLFREARVGERIDGWRVCWGGGWDRCRVVFVVMVEDDLGAETEPPPGKRTRRRQVGKGGANRMIR